VEVILASQLRISSYPTLVLAGPDGKILSTILGYKEAGEFYESLQRALAFVTSPDWMQRDLQQASKWIQSGNYARAIASLKTIIEDGRDRPVQTSAERLLVELEQRAAQRVTKARELENRGQSVDAIEALTEITRLFPGLQAAKEAADLVGRLAQKPEVRSQQRGRRARELLAQAREFYKNREYIPCLDRCEILVASYGDMAEGQEGAQILNEMKSNPAWMQNAADTMSD